jgi:hypothetical protein
MRDLCLLNGADMPKATPLLAALLATSVLDAGAAEFTDAWYVPSESGWGMNVVHQQEVAFVTLFLYAPSGEATWYSATLSTVGYLGANGLPVMSGALYRTRGPAPGPGFDPGAVTRTPVGSVHLSPRGLDEVDLHYAVDGVVMQKTVRRLTWRRDDHAEGYAASYAGRRVDSATGCVETFAETGGAFLEIRDGAARLRFQQGSAACDYRGEHVPSGRIASVRGEFDCTDGRRGTFDLTDLTVTPHGFNGRLRTQRGTVAETGALGGGTAPMHRP